MNTPTSTMSDSVRVPRVATPEIVEAMKRTLYAINSPNHQPIFPGEMEQVWAAGVAAAPAPAADVQCRCGHDFSRHTEDPMHPGKTYCCRVGNCKCTHFNRAADVREAVLVEALKPFADEAGRWDDIPGVVKYHDNVELWQTLRTKICVGDLRRAKSALASRPAMDEGTK